MRTLSTEEQDWIFHQWQEKKAKIKSEKNLFSHAWNASTSTQTKTYNNLDEVCDYIATTREAYDKATLWASTANDSIEALRGVLECNTHDLLTPAFNEAASIANKKSILRNTIAELLSALQARKKPDLYTVVNNAPETLTRFLIHCGYEQSVAADVADINIADLFSEEAEEQAASDENADKDKSEFFCSSLPAAPTADEPDDANWQRVSPSTTIPLVHYNAIQKTISLTIAEQKQRAKAVILPVLEAVHAEAMQAHLLAVSPDCAKHAMILISAMPIQQYRQAPRPDKQESQKDAPLTLQLTEDMLADNSHTAHIEWQLCKQPYLKELVTKLRKLLYQQVQDDLSDFMSEFKQLKDQTVRQGGAKNVAAAIDLDREKRLANERQASLLSDIWTLKGKNSTDMREGSAFLSTAAKSREKIQSQYHTIYTKHVPDIIAHVSMKYWEAFEEAWNLYEPLTDTIADKTTFQSVVDEIMSAAGSDDRHLAALTLMTINDSVRTDRIPTPSADINTDTSEQDEAAGVGEGDRHNPAAREEYGEYNAALRDLALASINIHAP